MLTPEELREGLDATMECVAAAKAGYAVDMKTVTEAGLAIAALRGMRVVAWYSGTTIPLDHTPPFDGAIPLFTLEPPR